MDGAGIVGIDPMTGERRGRLAPCPSSCDGGELAVSDWSPDGSQVAFVWTCMMGCSADDYGIYVADLATGEPHMVRPGLGYSEVAWSADGTRLAFLERGSLLTMDPDGSRVELVATGPRNLAAFSWAPDGSFALADRGRAGISVIGPNGGTPTRLIGAGSDPAWSPAGTSIAYRTGCSLWILPTDGRSGPTRVVDLRSLPGPSPSSDCRIRSDYGSFSFEFGQPAWSPDGSAIVVLGAHGGLVVVPIDGSAPTTLSRGTSQGMSAPSWRPIR